MTNIAGDLLVIVKCDHANLMQHERVSRSDGQSLTKETVSQLEVTGQTVLQANVENGQMTPGKQRWHLAHEQKYGVSDDI